MDFTDEEAAFCEEVRDFVRKSLPRSIRQKMLFNRELTKDDLITWTRILDKKGWAVSHWPVEWGGMGWSPVKQALFIDVMQQEMAPDTLSFGTSMVGPIIYTFGNETQKKRFLPRIVNLEDWWCQGFSEPQAGSDLASLRTTAVRDGDDYVVNGQKTWTTLGQHADWIFCLVRTNREVKKQAGISFLLIDMTSPGVTVRPIQTIDGGYEINDVFLDNVRVPAENLVGEENRGWDYAKFLLQHERTGIARVGASKASLRRARELAEREGRDNSARLDLPHIRSRIALLEVELKALEITQYRVLSEESQSGGNSHSPAASILKVKGSEIQQAISEVMLDLAGPHALTLLTPADGHNDLDRSWAGTVAETYLNWRKVSIYGGSNEIQRNIIAKQLLAS
nr:acyl-CoA dehydrogenase family protein [Oricola nitratireducens]